MTKDHEILLAELRGHPLQDYVDTVRGAVFDMMQQDESKQDMPTRPHEKRRGSERLHPLPQPEGVIAEQCNYAEWLTQRIAVSLFLKNRMS